MTKKKRVIKEKLVCITKHNEQTVTVSRDLEYHRLLDFPAAQLTNSHCSGIHEARSHLGAIISSFSALVSFSPFA